MDQSCIFQYEAEANASYLVAILPEAESFIQYQMKMMENNQIAHLLEARKYQQDETIHICYNVTSRMSLRQVLERQKMRKEEFLTLLTSLVETYRELSEYQLTAKGLVLEEDYIFVRSGSFVPSFVYLPIHTEEAGLEGLRDFVRETILNSRIASTTDNFIQRLLDLVNDPDMTLERLEEELARLRQPAAAPPRPQPQAAPVPEAPKPPVFDSTPPPPPAPDPVSHVAPTHAAEKKGGMKGPAKAREKKSSGSSSRSILFTAIQGVAVLLLALAVKAGLFIQDGVWNVSYLAGALIALVGIDFVIYRELFVNPGKKSGEKPAKNKAGKASKPAKKVGKKAPSAPKSGLRPPVRSAAPAPVQTPAPQPVHAAPPVQDQADRPVYTPPPAAAEQPVYVPAAPVYAPPAAPQAPAQPSAASFPAAGRVSVQDLDYGEDTVVIEEGAYGEGYLEYFENGLAMRIHLVEGVTRVGSRAQSVDHVLASHKVSKVHAEFIRRGGQYFVRDINSTNGTYLNGSRQRIVSNQDVELRDGDLVRLADIELTFKC